MTPIRRPLIAIALTIAAALAEASAGAEAPAELRAEPWLREVVRHLYRWYLDEPDLAAMIASDEVIFWVRETRPLLDEGDNSRFAEITLPQCALSVKVKRADYEVPELNAVVKNDTFRIVSVARLDAAAARPQGADEIRVNYTALRDELFRTRRDASFPEGDLLERLRAAVRAELAKDPERPREAAPDAVQVAHMAPLSPIANETWVYWESGRSLIRFTSDIDLSNPAVWEHETLAVRVYHLDRSVVVSFDEVQGSNAFMTRDQAGRALYNCMVLGRRLELTPPKPPAAPPQR